MTRLAQPERDMFFFADEATADNTNPQAVHGTIKRGWRAAPVVLSPNQ